MLNKFKFAFSLAEAIIIVTFLAIALAAATPFVTKKLINISEAASGSHGRIEIFMEEFIQFGDICKDKNNGYGCKKALLSTSETKRYVSIYQKLTDAEYTMVMKNAPESFDRVENDNTKHYKSTIYALITDKGELISSDNSLAKAKFENQIYESSSKFIIEPANVTFEGIGKANRKPRRVIEGNLTDENNFKNLPFGSKFKTYYDVDVETCFTIDGKNKANFNGKITRKPFKRRIAGKKIIEEKILEAVDLDNGKVKIQLPTNVKTFTFHAVGGGGAGGSVDTLNNPIIPSGNLSDTQKDIISHHLAHAFREYANERQKNVSGLQKEYIMRDNLSSLRDDEIVTFNGPMGNHWILVNTNDGTITVKTDARYGMIYPHQLLKYTETLGTSKQKSKYYYMPRWFTADLIKNRGFRIVTRVCSNGGSNGTSFEVKSTKPCDWLLSCYPCTRTVETKVKNQNDCSCGQECTSCCDGAASDWAIHKDIAKNTLPKNMKLPLISLLRGGELQDML